MNTLRIWLAVLLATNAGCGLFKVDREMQQARAELVLIVGQLTGSDSGRSALIALLDAQGKLLTYRIAAPGEDFYFTEAPGAYQLVAFDDRNGNFTLDPDEPRQWVANARSVPLHVQPDAATRKRLSQGNLIALRERDLAQAPAIDLRLEVLHREQPRMQRNYLQPVSFNDPRFSLASTQLGAWQPLTFLRDIGYGLYLLAPWDNAKEPIFLVHGINSSPSDWQDVAANIDTQRFQLVLFHYPSGVPLNNSAYMLSVGIHDIERRYAPTRLHVIAHSMGGLVARRALQMLGEENAQSVCLFVTLSTPWDGHPSAASGLQNVPLEVPVWKDMAPGSNYLQQLFASPLPAHIRQWLLVSYAGNSRLLPEPNDGVVPLTSELRNSAQDEARQIYLLNEDHLSILHSKRTKQLLDRALQRLPNQGCEG
ncbi:MAG: alpha/beta fold hydrolase [Pseudomonas sp.]|uniref:lipase family alpha/beta hydrolase n=1 Tax=Pseudomonas sp. TaxID=306 RepID=UPI0030F33BF1